MMVRSGPETGASGGSPTPEGTPFLLSLGSNLGDRRAHLGAGLRFLEECLEIEAVSRVVESEPWGPVPQGPYLNVVVRGRTRRTARDLLRIAGEAEEERGRKRGVRYGARTLDVDLLFFGELVCDEPELTVPHPRWWDRPFVYGLLREVAGDLTDPRSGRPVAEVIPDDAHLGALREVAPIGELPREEGKG